MSLPNIPDEYGIRNCLCSGYAYPAPKRKCRKCGAEAECYGDDSGYLCFDCAREEFEELSDVEAVELLGFEVIIDAP